MMPSLFENTWIAPIWTPRGGWKVGTVVASHGPRQEYISALPQRNRTGALGVRARPWHCGTLKVNQEEAWLP
jgi:hypothetical protein